MNSDGNVGQLRMLSPGGTNILEGSDTANYGEPDVVKRLNNVIRQNFSGIQADGRGFIYALDATYGLIYIYDTDSNLIAAFGGGRGAWQSGGDLLGGQLHRVVRFAADGGGFADQCRDRIRADRVRQPAPAGAAADARRGLCGGRTAVAAGEGIRLSQPPGAAWPGQSRLFGREL